ncbi:hypothetical protein, partial [Maribellus maritimus]|uniref:hypothetical protein n=1 Tax=Maribellus maritimus TaxID=2870838 RepID=UPI00374CE29D|nr:hypothetical protein [Maribellus maritimus]
RGYCADTIGLDEDKIKKYFKYQEEQERLEEQQRLNFGPLYGLSQVRPSHNKFMGRFLFCVF